METLQLSSIEGPSSTTEGSVISRESVMPTKNYTISHISIPGNPEIPTDGMGILGDMLALVISLH